MGSIIKPVELTSRAIKDVSKIKAFYTELYNKEKAQKFIDSIFEECKFLESPNNDFSEIGAIDKDFSHLKYHYRKLIIHHCKITYREGKNQIYIVRVFDTRQHPHKNK